MASAQSNDGRPAPIPSIGFRSADPGSEIARIPIILPHERVFPIQIGSQLFKLSGASLSSDAPSYFSQYFLCQLKSAETKGEDPGTVQIKTLYIDRDPGTFHDICLHLQGYHVQPRNATHFVRLFADAQFYTLPKLVSRLYEESIFISIGQREFQVPRDTFTEPGDSPNFFSLGFGVFFSSSDDLFPGLDRTDLIRPPSLLPPSVPNRDPNIFEELLRLLRGYPVHIRDEAHRQALLRDARYFHFKGVEQRLISHSLDYNLVRGRYEIVLRVENIQKSGISVSRGGEGDAIAGWVYYARPYVDQKAAELVMEIGGEATRISFSDGAIRAEFFNETKARITKLFEVIAAKLDLPDPLSTGDLLTDGRNASGSQPLRPHNMTLSDDLVCVVFEPESAIMLDGKEWVCEPWMGSHASGAQEDDTENSHKRRRTEDGDHEGDWTVRRGQWRLRIRSSGNPRRPVECVLVASKLEAVRSETARNQSRGFLP